MLLYIFFSFWGSHVWKIIRLLLQGNRRETRLLGILSFIHSTVWKVLFGKVLCPSCDCLFWFMSILAVGWLEFVFIKLYYQWFLDCKILMSWTRWLMDPQTQVARNVLMAATPHQEVYWPSNFLSLCFFFMTILNLRRGNKPKNWNCSRTYLFVLSCQMGNTCSYTTKHVKISLYGRRWQLIPHFITCPEL